MSSTNRNTLSSFFPICIPFISFFCTIALAETCSTILSKNSRSGYLLWFQILEEMHLASLHSVWGWLWVCHMQPLLCWCMVLLYLIYLSFFCLSWMGMNFMESFICIFERIMWFLSSFLDVICLLICTCRTIPAPLRKIPCDRGEWSFLSTALISDVMGLL